MTTRPPVSPEMPRNASLAVIALAILTVVACWLIPPANRGNEVGVNMDLPFEIGGLEGVPIPVSAAEKQILPPDTEFAGRAYGSFSLPETDWIDRFVCKIVLSGREKRSIHRPERCLKGQGWNVIDSRIIEVPLKSGHNLKVKSLLASRSITLRDGTTKTLKFCYLYWYVGRTVTTPYSFVRVFLTNWDLVVHRTNQRWAYLICAGYVTDNLVPNGRTKAQTVEQLKKFIADAAPVMMKSEADQSGSATR